MGLEYQQSTGLLKSDGNSIAVGYSGRGPGLNVPAMQNVPTVGPIPQGKWTIGACCDMELLGPLCLPLTPMPGTVTFGRSGFYIHGDNVLRNQSASHGCIVLARYVRESIRDLKETILTVIP